MHAEQLPLLIFAQADDVVAEPRRDPFSPVEYFLHDRLVAYAGYIPTRREDVSVRRVNDCHHAGKPRGSPAKQAGLGRVRMHNIIPARVHDAIQVHQCRDVADRADFPDHVWNRDDFQSEFPGLGEQFSLASCFDPGGDRAVMPSLHQSFSDGKDDAWRTAAHEPRNDLQDVKFRSVHRL
jgi:hypothetical protein